MAVRAALHQAGAAALSELLRFAAPAADQRTVPCDCGQRATYRELRTKGLSGNYCINFWGRAYSSNHRETCLSGVGVQPSVGRKP